MSRVATRRQDGYVNICFRCYETTEAECALCFELAPVYTRIWPVGSVCSPCYRRTLRTPSICPSCASVKALIGYSNNGERICGPCAGADLDYVCRVCGGAGERHLERTCIRCSITIITGELLASASGTIPAPLTGLPELLAEHGRPNSTLKWLQCPIPRALLQIISSEATISHAALDACPPGQARHHLRYLLVEAGVLPTRDEKMERLETWVQEYAAKLPTHHALVITPYAQWRVLRSVRRRAQRKRVTEGVATSARERIRHAARLLRHLDQHDMRLDELSQDVLDRWTRGIPTRSAQISSFIKWLNLSGLTTGLRVESYRPAPPSEINAEDEHHQLVRELITGADPSIALTTRVAGLLILLYGTQIERIHRLTTNDVSSQDHRVYLAITSHQVALPPPLGHLVLQLASEATSSPWSRTRTGDASLLFPSPRRRHEPMHPTTLGRKLALAGIHTRHSRNFAMLALTTDLPAAIVSTQFGLTPQTATKWAQYSQRDRIEYIVARAPASKWKDESQP